MSGWFGAKSTVELRPGWPVVCHPLAYRHSYYAQLEDPEQVAEFDAFVSHCSPGMILFDLGAHFGLFSLAALHYGGPAAKALAVDASPAAAAMIRAQARLNGVADRLESIEACVCDRPGTREMVSVGVQADGYFIPPTADHASRELKAVHATSVDDLMNRSGLRPTHIKIDVEGFEQSVFTGAEGLFQSGARPLIFLELHNQIIRERGEEPANVLQALAERGYVLKFNDGREAGSDEVLSRNLVRLMCHPRVTARATPDDGRAAKAALDPL